MRPADIDDLDLESPVSLPDTCVFQTRLQIELPQMSQLTLSVAESHGYGALQYEKNMHASRQ